MSEAAIQRIVPLVISKLGGRAATAEKLDVTPAAVSQWKRNGFPMHRIEAIAALSGVGLPELRAAMYVPMKRGPRAAAPPPLAVAP